MFSETLGYKCLRLLLIAVGKDFYRLGVGRSLVNAAKRVTVEEDYKTLLVGTSSINIPAQNLYISCGFYPYYSELSMEKLTR